LADEGRLRLLALANEEEFTVGEMADLLGESQSQVSRKAAPLRQAGLLDARKDGTRTLLRVPSKSPLQQDPVVQDALCEGRRLAEADGSLARIAAVLHAREERSLRFFDQEAGDPAQGETDLAAVLPSAASSAGAQNASLHALSALLPRRQLALDIGSGDGQMLEVLAPLYERVWAVDNSRGRLAQCAKRIAERGLSNARLFEGSFDDAALVQEVDRQGGADLVFAGRILHHVSRPSTAMAALARFLREGAHLVILDYLPHPDERMREEQADVWLGFDPEELSQKLEELGLVVVAKRRVPDAYRPPGPDAHLEWHAWVAQKPFSGNHKGSLLLPV
jgi:ArsR family transcriptional regulator